MVIDIHGPGARQITEENDFKNRANNVQRGGKRGDGKKVVFIAPISKRKCVYCGNIRVLRMQMNIEILAERCHYCLVGT